MHRFSLKKKLSYAIIRFKLNDTINICKNRLKEKLENHQTISDVYESL